MTRQRLFFVSGTSEGLTGATCMVSLNIVAGSLERALELAKGAEPGLVVDRSEGREHIDILDATPAPQVLQEGSVYVYRGGRLREVPAVAALRERIDRHFRAKMPAPIADQVAAPFRSPPGAGLAAESHAAAHADADEAAWRRELGKQRIAAEQVGGTLTAPQPGASPVIDGSPRTDAMRSVVHRLYNAMGQAHHGAMSDGVRNAIADLEKIIAGGPEPDGEEDEYLVPAIEAPSEHEQRANALADEAPPPPSVCPKHGPHCTGHGTIDLSDDAPAVPPGLESAAAPAPESEGFPTDAVAERCGVNALMWADAFLAANASTSATKPLLAGWFALAIQRALDLSRKAADGATVRCMDCGEELRGIASVAPGLGCAGHREVDALPNMIRGLARAAALYERTGLMIRGDGTLWDDHMRNAMAAARASSLAPPMGPHMREGGASGAPTESEADEAEIRAFAADLAEQERMTEAANARARAATRALEDVWRAAGLGVWRDTAAARAQLVESVGSMRRALGLVNQPTAAPLEQTAAADLPTYPLPTGESASFEAATPRPDAGRMRSSSPLANAPFAAARLMAEREAANRPNGALSLLAHARPPIGSGASLSHAEVTYALGVADTTSNADILRLIRWLATPDGTAPPSSGSIILTGPEADAFRAFQRSAIALEDAHRAFVGSEKEHTTAMAHLARAAAAAGRAAEPAVKPAEPQR